MKILVAYDGSLNSKTALRYGIQRAKEGGGGIIVLHVFNKGLFIDYDASPKAEGMARIESARYVEDARRILEESGKDIASRIIVEEGNPAEETLRYAESENVDLIFSPPGLGAQLKNALCPVSIIPGYVVLPLDNTECSPATLDRMVAEIKATLSKVILLGIVPIHIYNKWEKGELRKVEKETSALMKRVRKFLTEQQIETKEIMRWGYPDEEIAKIADEFPVSFIVMPAKGEEPSELSKAAAILSEKDSGNVGRPPVFLHACE